MKFINLLLTATALMGGMVYANTCDKKDNKTAKLWFDEACDNGY